MHRQASTRHDPALVKDFCIISVSSCSQRYLCCITIVINKCRTSCREFQKSSPFPKTVHIQPILLHASCCREFQKSVYDMEGLLVRSTWQKKSTLLRKQLSWPLWPGGANMSASSSLFVFSVSWLLLSPPLLLCVAAAACRCWVLLPSPPLPLRAEGTDTGVTAEAKEAKWHDSICLYYKNVVHQVRSRTLNKQILHSLITKCSTN